QPVVARAKRGPLSGELDGVLRNVHRRSLLVPCGSLGVAWRQPVHHAAILASSPEVPPGGFPGVFPGGGLLCWRERSRIHSIASIPPRRTTVTAPPTCITRAATRTYLPPRGS